MTVRIIPAVTEIICDMCRVKTDKSIGKAGRLRGGVMVITSNGLDCFRQPMANCDNRYDLCDNCLGKIEEFISNNQTESNRET